MLNQELLTATIAGRGDILRHQPISEAKIILEFLPRQIHAIKGMYYSTKPCPIPRCPMEAVFLLASCLILTFEELGELDDNFTKSHQLAGLTYACPMAYVIEGRTS